MSGRALLVLCLFILVVTAAIFGIFTLFTTDVVPQIVSACAREHGLSQETAVWLTTTNKGFPVLVEENEKCFIKCIMVANEYMDREGLWTPRIYDALKPGYRVVVNKCAVETKSPDPCEQAYQYHKCLMEDGQSY